MSTGLFVLLVALGGGREEGGKEGRKLRLGRIQFCGGKTMMMLSESFDFTDYRIETNPLPRLP